MGTEPLAGVTLPGPLRGALVLTVTLTGSNACAPFANEQWEVGTAGPQPSPTGAGGTWSASEVLPGLHFGDKEVV